MAGSVPLFQLNDALDRAALARAFAAARRVQVRDLLTAETAARIARVLAREVPWGLAWSAGDQAPINLRAPVLRAMAPEGRAGLATQAGKAVGDGKFAFLYRQYPMVDAYLQQWSPGHPLDLLLEHINDRPLMDLVRTVTGIPDLRKADAQATFYAPGDFLASHDDEKAGEGRRIAYVLGFAREWRADWGGYLLFHDEEGDVVAGFKPRFNALNLFAVPQRHSVSYVPPFAPAGRLAITGWFRDR